MFIKCWGSRGSIPVSGIEYLKYGGDTTCIQIKASSGHTVIIDAGTGIRRFGTLHKNGGISEYTLLLTHAHNDHVIGFNFFKPLLDPNCTITIQNHCFSGKSTQNILEGLMSPPLFPITMADLPASIRFRDDLTGTFSLGSLTIQTISLSHPNGGFGYRITENGRSFVFLTDNELGFDHPGSAGRDAFELFSKNADLLFHDAEFFPDEYRTKTGWGHSSCMDVLTMATAAGVKKLGLFHLNQDRPDQEMDRMVDQCRVLISKTATGNPVTMDCFGVASEMEFTL
ncbi:MAG: MBL fold metallo-hydrolase [Pseudomonadota bacterium]